MSLVIPFPEKVEAAPITGGGAGGSAAGVNLIIRAYDPDGNLTDEVCKDGDLYLYNWACLIAGMFKYGFNYAGVKKYNFKKEDETTQQIGDSVYWYRAVGYWINAGKLLIGGSSQVAAIGDCTLYNKITEVVPNLPTISVQGNIIKVIFTGTAAFASQQTVAECAVRIEQPFVQDVNVCITRDTFAPVVVQAGGTLTIQVELWFNGMPS